MEDCTKLKSASPASTRDCRSRVVTEDEISMDGIQSGLCDLDPFNNRIYHRVNGMKMFTTEGESLGSI